MTIDDLIRKVAEYLPEARVATVREASEFAATAHAGQTRRSGGPFLEHPLQTAAIIADLQLDAASITASLLHDVPEDCGVPLKDIEQRFGAEVAKLVDGVTKLTRIARHADGKLQGRGIDDEEMQAENIRKMLVAMAEDVRVVLIKLADRLHNMRTLGALSAGKRGQIARQTMDIYAPLAHRLGIFQVEWQLEDLAFRYLAPDRYREIARLVAQRRASRERYIQQVSQVLVRELDKAKIKAEVTGRPKHIFSIHQKMEKYAAQGKDFEDIHDLLALRVLVNSEQDCYAALGVVHSLWRPLPGQFDDYIANPKEGGYQSLHTTVMCLGAKALEIQIRSYEMHRIAEYGVAAHWRYKGAGKDGRFADRISWLRQLLEWQRELAGAREFVESVKTDIFRDQVFVYTPKGEIKDLPAGATPLDFAYRIHTNVGHRCVGAKVNGRLVPLTYELQNGDVVEIVASHTARGPSLDWLNPHIGYVHTSHAREKIRQWFKRQARGESVTRGKEILEKELRRLGIPFSEQERIARLFNQENLEDFYADLGSGGISAAQIPQKLWTPERPQAPYTLPDKPATSIQVLGVGDLLTSLARCCNPVPGDEILGYITRTRGVTIHRRDCPNVLHEDEKERLVRVDWGPSDERYPVAVRIEAWDRVGLLRDISTMVSEEKVNMTAVSTQEHDDQTTSVFLTLQTTGIGQLTRLMSKLEGIRGVTSVVRHVEDSKRDGRSGV